MARQISFEKILATLNELSQRIAEASEMCFEKRIASTNEEAKIVWKCEEKHYDYINDLIGEAIVNIEEWLMI